MKGHSLPPMVRWLPPLGIAVLIVGQVILLNRLRHAGVSLAVLSALARDCETRRSAGHPVYPVPPPLSPLRCGDRSLDCRGSYPKKVGATSEQLKDGSELVSATGATTWIKSAYH
jgi:hypothetical protein